jgi:hypothetical protein
VVEEEDAVDPLVNGVKVDLSVYSMRLNRFVAATTPMT